MKYKMTKEERDARVNARWRIIQIVNNHIMHVHRNNFYMPTMLEYKHIQRAVHIGRQAMILPGKLLREAGFKPHVAKPGKPTVLKRLLGE